MIKNSIYALVSQFLGQQNNISVPVPLVRIIGDYAGAAFASQVVYWSDRSENTDGWFWKTHEQWFSELHLTSDQIRRCVRSADGLVEVKKAGVPARNYYRVNRELLIQRLQELADLPEDDQIVTTTSNGQTQRLEMDKSNDKKLDNPTASRTGNPMTKSKTSSKTTFKETSVSNVTENAREETSPAAPVVEPSSVPHTTSEASPSKDVKALREHSMGVATLPPDGGAADAAITDLDLEFLFGTAEGPQETSQVESRQKARQKVPGGGAAALLAQLESRAGALRPVDRKELLERPLAVPSDTTYRLVKGLVGGNKAIDDGILDTLTPTGALSRRDWLRLSEGELILARQVAQTEAQAEKLNFYTCAIRALDVLIGAPIGQTGRRGGPADAVVANAGCLAPAQHFEAADRSADVGKFDTGAAWIRRLDDLPVTITRTERVKRRSTEGLVYHLSDGKTCNALQLMTGYAFREAGGTA